MNCVIRPLNNCSTCSHNEHCYIYDPTFCHSWEPDEAECKRIAALAKAAGEDSPDHTKQNKEDIR